MAGLATTSAVPLLLSAGAGSERRAAANRLTVLAALDGRPPFSKLDRTDCKFHETTQQIIVI